VHIDVGFDRCNSTVGTLTSHTHRTVWWVTEQSDGSLLQCHLELVVGLLFPGAPDTRQSGEPSVRRLTILLIFSSLLLIGLLLNLCLGLMFDIY
jgi:hypothetical protein